MAKNRHIIRKVNRAEVVGFDDQLWPVNLALVLLGAFVAGIIIAKGGFDDPRLLYNGWARLATLAITLGAMFWGVSHFDRRVGRRIQLAALISLLFHLAIAVYMTGKYLELVAQQEQERARLLESQEVVTAPEYVLPNPEAPEEQQDFDKPVDVEVPEEQLDAPTRTQTDPKQNEALRRPTTVPEVATPPEPSPINAQRQQMSAPRRADHASRLSKQTAAARMEAATAADAPQPQPAPAAAQAAPLAPATPVERRANQAKIARRLPLPDPQTPVQQEVAHALNRAESADATAKPSSTPTLQRTVAQATQVPRAAVPQQLSAQPTQQTKPTEPQPTATIVERSQAAAPQLQKREAAPAVETSSTVAEAEAARQQPSETQPTLARVPSTAPNRRPVEASVASAAPEVPRTATPATPAAQATPQATAPEVARTATQSPTRRQQTSSAPPTPSPTATAAAAAQAARASDSPSPTAAAAQQPQRTTGIAAATATPAENVAASAPAVQQESAPQAPAATSVARSQMAGPQAAKPQDYPRSQGPTTVVHTGVLRQTTSEEAPSLAATERPTAARQTVETAVASEAAQVAQSTPTNRPSATASPGAHATELARAESQAPALSNWQPRPADGPTSQSAVVATQAAAQRAASSPQPSLTPSASSQTPPRRTTDQAAVASSPLNVTSPAIASGSSQDRPAARPSSAALSKSESGFTGRGRSQNAGVAMAADPRQLAPVASAAARRPEASQEQAGPALSPSAPARIVKAVAGADAPAASMQAQPVPSAELAGAQQPSEQLASASAALERQNANAPQRTMTASAGEVEVDTGVTQVVPDLGTGRADGGGQPELAFNPPDQKIERARAGGGALAAIAAPAVQPSPAAPEAAGGGSPPGPQVSNLADAGGAKASIELTRTAQAPGDLPAAAGSGSQAAVAPALARAVAGGGGATSAGQTLPTPGEGMKLARQAPAGGVAAAATAADVPALPAGGAPAATPGATDAAVTAVAAAAAAEVERSNPASLPAAAQAAAVAAGPQAGAAAAQEVSAQLARANLAEALPGVLAGGGTQQPERNLGREVAMVVPASATTIEAVPQQGGAPEGQPQTSAVPEAGPAPTGLTTKASTLPSGAIAGPIAVDAPAAGSPGAGTIVAQTARGSAGEPALGTTPDSGALAKQGAAAVPLGAAEGELEEILAAMASVGNRSAGTASGGLDEASDELARMAASLPVHVKAEAGPGGLASALTPEVGIESRRAQRDSEVIKREPGKYLQKLVSGAPAVSGLARNVAEPFARRTKRIHDPGAGGAGKPSAKTEIAIEQGVDFLIRHQSPDGSWSFQDFGQGRPGYEDERATIRSDAAATGLALLALLGAGYDQFEDKYQHNVAAGLNWLLEHQQAGGNLYVPQDRESNKTAQLYSHGIAALALCEAYGMTGDPALGDAAQRAIDYIVASQHPTRGGWRYTPGYSSDLSVSGWQLMALKSGELAGLKVPKQTYDKVVHYLDRCVGPDGDSSKYVYNPQAPDTRATRHGRRASTTMTSVGLLMRMYTGWNREHPAMQRGADFLLTCLPTYGETTAPVERRFGTIANPLRDTYYWYYATQVMFHMQGEYWAKWNDRLHPLLAKTQIQSGIFAGSWNPREPIADTWAAQGGRIYVTTLNLLSLEVYYRHLPIYEDTAK